MNRPRQSFASAVVGQQPRFRNASPVQSISPARITCTRKLNPKGSFPMTTVYDFSYFPLLETERLRLRQITRADAPAIIRLFGDPDVLTYLDLDPPVTTTEQAVGMIDWLGEMFDQKNGVRWAITLQTDDTLMGTIGFHRWNRDNRHAEIGYDLIRDHWRQGYVTEAAQALVRWCFLNLDLHRIEADCTAGNLGSEAVLRKLGFTYEGTWRERCFEHGRFVDIKQFSLLRREYLPV